MVLQRTERIPRVLDFADFPLAAPDLAHDAVVDDDDHRLETPAGDFRMAMVVDEIEKEIADAIAAQLLLAEGIGAALGLRFDAFAYAGSR